jgi:hypothetical protein
MGGGSIEWTEQGDEVRADGKNGLAGSRVLSWRMNPLVRLLLTEFLSDEGFNITEAESGDRAIVLLDNSETFELVLGLCPEAWCRSHGPRSGSRLIRRPHPAA